MGFHTGRIEEQAILAESERKSGNSVPTSIGENLETKEPINKRRHR